MSHLLTVTLKPKALLGACRRERKAQLLVTTSSRCADCLHFSLGCAGADVGLSASGAQ